MSDIQHQAAQNAAREGMAVQREIAREARIAEVAETMFQMDDSQRPEPHQLELYESNPNCSIGVFWSMSGYGFAPAGSEELNNPDEDSPKFRTAKAAAQEYLERVKVTAEEEHNCIAKFNAEMDPSQPLLTCAATTFVAPPRIIRSTLEVNNLLTNTIHLQCYNKQL